MNFMLLVARAISHSFAALTREILLLPLEHKIHIFSPPCNILYIASILGENVRAYLSADIIGHYLFLEVNSFPRAKLEENCELRGTGNDQGQLSEHFSPKMEAIVFIVLQIFFATRTVLNTGEYSG